MKLLDFIARLNARKGRILQMAEAALPATQFRAFRRSVLDELGRDGLERDVERLLAEGDKERDRAGQADTCKKGGAR